FFSSHPATTEIYTLSYTTLFRSNTHFGREGGGLQRGANLAFQFIGIALRVVAADGNGAAVGIAKTFQNFHCAGFPGAVGSEQAKDRKSTRLNSSHLVISYAVFCL